VIYVCAADSQRRPSILSAASKGLLMRHAASLEFARTIVEGGCPDAEELGSVWAAATTAPQLRSVLRQYEVACIVRESMVHPDDLKALAVAA
jgi:hypothetical protein